MSNVCKINGYDIKDASALRYIGTITGSTNLTELQTGMYAVNGVTHQRFPTTDAPYYGMLIQTGGNNKTQLLLGGLAGESRCYSRRCTSGTSWTGWSKTFTDTEVTTLLNTKISKSAQPSKTASMTQDVGIDSNGRLWTAPGGGGGENNFELIEKIIVGYSLTTEEPDDWATNYTDYFINTGTLKEPTYTAVTGETAPPWVANTYYSYDPNGYRIVRSTEPDGTPYSFKKVWLKLCAPQVSAVQSGLYFYCFNTSNEKVSDIWIGNYGNIYRSSGYALYIERDSGIWKNIYYRFADYMSLTTYDINKVPHNTPIANIESHTPIIGNSEIIIYGVRE